MHDVQMHDAKESARLKRSRESASPASGTATSSNSRSGSMVNGNTTTSISRASSAAPSNASGGGGGVAPHSPPLSEKAASVHRSRSPSTPTQRDNTKHQLITKSPPASPTTAAPPAKKQRASNSPNNEKVTDGGDDDDYKSGIVVCGTCRARIPFRDPATGAFSLKRWDEHREACKSTSSSTAQPNGRNGGESMTPSSPPNTSRAHLSPSSGSAHIHSASHHHPSASASSAYPSQNHHHQNQNSHHVAVNGHSGGSPDDGAQQQKKRRAKRTERERIQYLAADPYVAEFEAYRVRCGACQRWIRLRPNSTYCSIPWDAHRRSCLAKRGGGGAVGMNGSANNTRKPPTTTKPALPHPMHRQNSFQSANTNSSTTEYDHDLDADADGELDAEGEDDDTMVENGPPGDAYNGNNNSHHNHRQYVSANGHGNGTVKPPSNGSGRGRPSVSASASFDEDDDLDADADEDAEGEIDEDVVGAPSEQVRQPHQHHQHHRSHDSHQQQKSSGHAGHHSSSATATNGYTSHSQRSPNNNSNPYPQANGYPAQSQNHRSQHQQSSGVHRTSNAGYVRKEHRDNHHHYRDKDHLDSLHQQDLTSREGRLAFISLSVRHLFRTSYDARGGDELTAMALVNYLNAAMPADKHEEFDLSEVTKAVAGALKDRGIVRLEGDVVRLVG